MFYVPFSRWVSSLSSQVPLLWLYPGQLKGCSRGGGSGSAGAAGADLRVVAQSDYLPLKTIYSKPSVARTLMANLLRLFRIRS